MDHWVIYLKEAEVYKNPCKPASLGQRTKIDFHRLKKVSLW